MSPAITVLPVQGLPEVEPGADLAALVAARAALRDGDVVVVAQKVVSKSEGRIVPLGGDEDPASARRGLARREAAGIVADAPWALITRTMHGFVCANAGIDASNVPGDAVTLLPVDPDASARRLRAGLRAAAGVDVAVIVADTFGRAWRIGQTDVAIGLAGVGAIRDERGGIDRCGSSLEVTEPAVADELAGAADLVRRKADGVPVVVVRGYPWDPDDGARATDLVRPAAADLFSRGRGGLTDALAARDVAAPPPRLAEPVADVDLERALRAARAAGDGRVEIGGRSGEWHAGGGPTRVAGGGPTRVAVRPRQADEVGLVAVGAMAATLVAALLDLGYEAVGERVRDGRGVAISVVAGRR